MLVVTQNQFSVTWVIPEPLLTTWAITYPCFSKYQKIKISKSVAIILQYTFSVTWVILRLWVIHMLSQTSKDQLRWSWNTLQTIYILTKIVRIKYLNFRETDRDRLVKEMGCSDCVGRKWPKLCHLVWHRIYNQVSCGIVSGGTSDIMDDVTWWCVDLWWLSL